MRPTRGSISAPAKYIPPQRSARGNNFERLEIVAEKHWNIILE